jgi:hypothetical protein
MASDKQIAANRRNGLRSTGPRSAAGKLKARRNALKHGLCAETVIDVIENSADYRRFAAAIASDYAPSTRIEAELVARLASLLWRLRRATAIESGLFQIHGEQIRQHQAAARSTAATLSLMARLDLLPADPAGDRSVDALGLARCFVRLGNLNPGIFERLGRYEHMLWRQAVQILFLLRGNTKAPGI